jgi:hypothetical protein
VTTGLYARVMGLSATDARAVLAYLVRSVPDQVVEALDAVAAGRGKS